MRVIIAGSRTFNNCGYFKEKMLEVQKQINIDEIISGMAKGPDLMGAYWGERHNIPVKKFYADWEKYGNAAGYIRNVEMAQAADFLIAFWDGKSKGTKHMIDTMKKQGKHGIVFISE